MDVAVCGVVAPQVDIKRHPARDVFDIEVDGEPLVIVDIRRRPYPLRELVAIKHITGADLVGGGVGCAGGDCPSEGVVRLVRCPQVQSQPQPLEAAGVVECLDRHHHGVIVLSALAYVVDGAEAEGGHLHPVASDQRVRVPVGVADSNLLLGTPNRSSWVYSAPYAADGAGSGCDVIVNVDIKGYVMDAGQGGHIQRDGVVAAVGVFVLKHLLFEVLCWRHYKITVVSVAAVHGEVELVDAGQVDSAGGAYDGVTIFRACLHVQLAVFG